MKSNLKYAWLTLGVVGLLNTAAVIHGQSTTASVATVPFNFTVGDTHLPAGAYRFTELNTEGTMQIRNAEDGHSIMVNAATPKGSQAESSKLVFRCYGGNCFLSEIWYQGEASGHGLAPGKHEKEIAQADWKNVIVAMR